MLTYLKTGIQNQFNIPPQKSFAFFVPLAVKYRVPAFPSVNFHGNQFCNIFLIKEVSIKALNIIYDKEALGAFFCLYLDTKFNATFRPIFNVCCRFLSKTLHPYLYHIKNLLFCFSLFFFRIGKKNSRIDIQSMTNF